MNDYQSFLESKRKAHVDCGFDADVSLIPKECFDFQRDIITWACKKGRAAIFAGTGLGKCHGKGTKILMYDGSIKNVEDIKVGEQLMGPDSKPRNVLSLARGIDEMFLISPIKGESWTCN